MLRLRDLVMLAFAIHAASTLSVAAQRDGLNIRGCKDAVGTYMTSRSSEQDGKSRIDRALIALTNGGHGFVTDSEECGLDGTKHFSDGRSV